MRIADKQTERWTKVSRGHETWRIYEGQKIPRTLQAVETSGNCTSIRFTKWPISDRMSDREDAPNTPLQSASNFYNGRNRRDQHSRSGDRTARRSGKLRAGKQDHLSECIVRSWHSLKSLADAFRDAERTRSQVSERFN